LGCIGIDDNFFEFGGHSLLALQLVSQLRKKLSIKVSARDIFLSPTIRQLAVELETKEKQTKLSA
jgi:acyl carrier protein